ncbi:MAG: hypothetical protein R2855_01550 [Thermomicrobiales bacterium]
MHRFKSRGELRASWGGDGSEPGRFPDAVHSIWVDADERVYAANGRVQVFDDQGAVLAIWDGFSFPHDIFQTRSESIVTDCTTRDDDPRPITSNFPAHPLVELERWWRADRYRQWDRSRRIS